MENVYDERSVIEVAVEAGSILVENGAEISRVEDTIKHICAHYGLYDEEFYVLVNGLFMAGGASDKTDPRMGRHFATVKYIPNRSVQLEKIVAVNQLSREIEAGKHTIEEAKKELERIRNIKGKSMASLLFFSGVGSMCFCYMLGGTWRDSIVAFGAGFLLYLFFLWMGKHHLSRITSHVVSSALAALVCLICYQLGIGDNLNGMLIGAIIPLIPGSVFISGVRDLADGHHLSGAVRLLEATILFVCIAIGIGAVLLVYHEMFGGVLI